MEETIRIRDSSPLRLKRLIQDKPNHCLTSIIKESKVKGEGLKFLGGSRWSTVAVLLASKVTLGSLL